MNDIVFIGHHRDAALFREAGIPSYAPEPGHITERVLAEKRRCRILAMTEDLFRALPAALARELREGPAPQLEIVSETLGDASARRVLSRLETFRSGGLPLSA